MLARTAANLFCIGRYIERAEFTTRLIEATIRYALDHETLSEAARELMQNALSEMGVTELA